MRLHVERSGNGSPTLVLLHGMGANRHTWDEFVRRAADRHATVAIDLLGHGDSPVPDDESLYTRDATLADIDDVLASIHGPAVLVGHSLGGYLALAHAATRPGAVEAIVVLNTGPGFRDAEKREGWNAMSRRNAHRFGVPVQAANLNLQHDSVVMDHLADMATPTLFLAGTLDRPDYTNSGQYLAKKMPNCTFRAIDGGEHNMQETHAAEIATAIDEFLAALSPGT